MKFHALVTMSAALGVLCLGAHAFAQQESKDPPPPGQETPAAEEGHKRDGEGDRKESGRGGGGMVWRVRTDPARMENIEQRRDVTGEVRAWQRSIVASEGDGQVLEILVRPGDAVSAGQALARLNGDRAELLVARADAAAAAIRSEIQAWEADVEKLNRDATRMEQSFQENGATDTERADKRSLANAAQARLAKARSELARAEADASLARKDLDDLTVRAPFDGRIVSRQTEVGQWLNEGDPVVTLITTDRVEVWLDVPEMLIARLAGWADGSQAPEPSAIVQIRVGEATTPIEAPITAIVPDADVRSRLVPVRVELKNPEGRLIPGMSVVGSVPAGTNADHLTVHKDAILRGPTGAYVYLAMDGKAIMAPVEILFGVGERLAVRSQAVRAGADVIVEGNERLYPTADVAATAREPVTPAASSSAKPH